MATVLAPAVVLVPIWFLLLSPVGPVARGESGPSVEAPPGNGTPVVLVVFDEFSGLTLLTPEGRMDSARVPNLAALDATWFRNATAAADTTVQAVPAIASGRLKWGELPVAKDYPRNIFSLLDGYRMHTYEPITNLCEDCQDDSWSDRVGRLRKSIWRLTEQRLKRVDPESVLAVPFSSILDRDRIWREWSEGATGGRTLNFLHIELPHTPWWFDPSGHQYTGQAVIPDLDGETWTKDAAVVADWKDRYVQQVQFVDSLVGELRQTLERKGIWDKALVIFVADHGVAFQPGMSRRFVGDDRVFPEVASVPLFVKAPGQSTRRVDESFVKTSDVFTTVGDYLGLDWPGHSLRNPVSRRKISWPGSRRAARPCRPTPSSSFVPPRSVTSRPPPASGSHGLASVRSSRSRNSGRSRLPVRTPQNSRSTCS